MSRSAAARADHDRAVRAARHHAPAVPRRISGPTHPTRTRLDPRAVATADGALAPRPRTPSRPPLRLAAGGASLALRVADTAMHVSGSRTMDRLVRSRGWVLIVAFGLIGIVAMQVSLLKLNAGIGRAVETTATLERGNAALRGEISRLSSGNRIQALAGARGYVMPEPADVTYLRAGDLRSVGLRAAKRMRASDAAIAGPAGSAVAEAPPALTGVTLAPAATPSGSAPATPADPAALPAAAATQDGGQSPAPVATQTAAHPPVVAPGAVAAAPAAVQASSSGGVTVP